MVISFPSFYPVSFCICVPELLRIVFDGSLKITKGGREGNVSVDLWAAPLTNDWDQVEFSMVKLLHLWWSSSYTSLLSFLSIHWVSYLLWENVLSIIFNKIIDCCNKNDHANKKAAENYEGVRLTWHSRTGSRLVNHWAIVLDTWMASGCKQIRLRHNSLPLYWYPSYYWDNN